MVGSNKVKEEWRRNGVKKGRERKGNEVGKRRGKNIEVVRCHV